MLTVERLRAEIAEKEELNQHMMEEHTKTKRDLEKHINELTERVNAKIAENEALKKAKDTLQKDYTDISAILVDKMSGKPLATTSTTTTTGQPTAHVQNQVTQLGENLQNQLLTKNQREEKERSKLPTEVEKLESKNVEPSTSSQIKEDQQLDAVIIIQSHLRGIKTRKEYKDHKYRLQITRNILSSEHTYLSSLRTLVDCYIEPLHRQAHLTEQEIGVVFGNIQEILKNNTLFLEALEERVNSWHVNQAIGDIFVKYMDGLKLHAKYIEHCETNREAKERILSEKSKEHEVFFKDVSTLPQVEGRTLNDFQTVPLSRILSYKLYLTDMVQHTPKHHPDYDNLSLATTQISLE
jgi:hypothetical protein